MAVNLVSPLAFSTSERGAGVCLFFLVLLGGPRIGIIFWWLVEPSRWSHAFSSFIIPVFGFIFLPWTTLMFVAVAPFGNVADFDWVWLALAFVVDITMFATSGYRSRGRIPGYTY
jgi:hypothetical protein